MESLENEAEKESLGLSLKIAGASVTLGLAGVVLSIGTYIHGVMHDNYELVDKARHATGIIGISTVLVAVGCLIYDSCRGRD